MAYDDTHEGTPSVLTTTADFVLSKDGAPESITIPFSPEEFALIESAHRHLNTGSVVEAAMSGSGVAREAYLEGVPWAHGLEDREHSMQGLTRLYELIHDGLERAAERPWAGVFPNPGVRSHLDMVHAALAPFFTPPTPEVPAEVATEPMPASPQEHRPRLQQIFHQVWGRIWHSSNS